ncbi:telomerase inhibitor [Lambiella insularis]|nr:telomerase inhibitor [Lambiella insularis]
MGLGAPRKRAKLSYDPNNTTWSKETTNYGHKMLLSQGWTPGTHLGAIDAPHSHLHSDASISHIRVAAKDDNLGIGAKRGSGVDVGECTGLDVFQSLLGRLNGKAEAVLEKEQKARDDLKRIIYAEKRWGSLNFVSGGLLVGDKIQKILEAEKSRLANKSDSILTLKASDTPLSSKIASDVQQLKELPRVRTTSSKAVELQPVLLAAEEEKEPDFDNTMKSVGKSLDKAKRKAERAQRKCDRRKRKDERRAARVSPINAEGTAQVTSVSLQEPNTKAMAASIETGSALVLNAAQMPLGGRHAVRQRYIRQKKMAMMDPKALNEILMVKA